MIESSFLKQYGIRLRMEENLSWMEFCNYLSGLMPDTPLGNVVSIRAEKDINVLNNFSPEQKRIRNEWLSRHGNGGIALTNMQGMFRDMCLKK